MGRKVWVEFSDGTSRCMTLRELCGWARARGARIRTDDGWPVVNGRILSFGTPALHTGVVRSPELNSTLATWRVLPRRSRSRSEPLVGLQRQQQEAEQAEHERVIRS